MKPSSEESRMRRVPRRAPPRMRTQRLATGGLKLLHGCGRVSRSRVDRLSLEIGSRSPTFGSRIYSGCEEIAFGIIRDIENEVTSPLSPRKGIFEDFVLKLFQPSKFCSAFTGFRTALCRGKH